MILNTQAQTVPKLSFDLIMETKNCSNKTLHITVLSKQAISLQRYIAAIGGQYINGSGNVHSVIFPCDQIVNLSQQTFVDKIIYDRHGGLQLLDEAKRHNHITKVHSGLDPLPYPVTGKGVIIGIIDNPGIDYNHPDFRNDDGTTRILYYWNMLQPYDGNRLGYGTLVDSATINGYDDNHVPPNLENAHHTGVGGIAFGNGNSYAGMEGVATEADIISVAINFEGGFQQKFLDAVRFIFETAEAQGKPCVINSSVGCFFGTYDGKDIYSKQIDSLINSQPGRVLIQANGNAGDRKMHAKFSVNQDTLITRIGYNDAFKGQEHGYFVFEEQYKSTLDFRWLIIDPTDKKTVVASSEWISFDDFEATNESYLSIPLVGPNHPQDDFTSDAYLFKDDKTYQYYHTPITELSQYNIWEFQIRGEGIVDFWSWMAWNNVGGIFNKTTVPDSYPLLSKYVNSDLASNLIGYWNCLESVISVGNYINKDTLFHYDNAFTLSRNIEGSLFNLSGRGPTRNGIIKPNICSTGQRVFSAAPQNIVQNQLNQNAFSTIHQSLYHLIGGGTSFAAPFVTGAVALYLQLHPTADINTIKEDLFNTAYEDDFVITSGNTPNNAWGHGKLHVYDFLANSLTYGCKDEYAINYNVAANVSDNSLCEYTIGCKNPIAINYDADAFITDNSRCEYLQGCTDSLAINYHPGAGINDGTCFYYPLNYDQFGNEFFITPNPVNDESRFFYANKDNNPYQGNLILMSINGSIIDSKKIDLQSKSYFKYNFESLSSGNYIVQFVSGKATHEFFFTKP